MILKSITFLFICDKFFFYLDRSSSQPSIKRSSSQIKAGTTQQDPAPRVSQHIPEETPSEVAKENVDSVPTSPAGDETDASQANDGAITQKTSKTQAAGSAEAVVESAKEGSQRGSQIIPKRASQSLRTSQISAKLSTSGNRRSSQVSRRGSAQLPAKSPSSENKPDQPDAPPAEE